MGQEVEVRPGVVTKDANGVIKCIPIRSRIISLFAEQNPLQYAAPGGLIGVGTTVDPTLTRADRLVGQVLGEVGALPDVFTELEINFFLLRRLLGVRTSGDEKQGKVRGWFAVPLLHTPACQPAPSCLPFPSTAHPHRTHPSSRSMCAAGQQAGEERGADAQHWVHVYGGQGGSGEHTHPCPTDLPMMQPPCTRGPLRPVAPRATSRPQRHA
jgi:hypothetical protein